MGRNSEIKRFRATRYGQTLDLFESHTSRLPVLLELLASPWVMRASEIVCRDASPTPKCVAEDVVVEWDPDRGCPRAFVRAGGCFRIDAVLQSWSTERAWWDPRRHVSRRYWRVLARGGVYDLAFDRMDSTWRLTGIHD